MRTEYVSALLAVALHHARLADRFAYALVMDGADVMDEVKFHGRMRDRYRQQAYALTFEPLWVRPKFLAWND
jgi:hypothetical protein